MPTARDLAFEFIERLDFVEDETTLTVLLASYGQDLGVEGVFIADVPQPGAPIEPHILLRGWSPDWISRYSRKNYVHVDPVAKKLGQQTTPFAWKEAVGRTLTPDETLVMGEAAEHGLADGFTVPIYGVHGQQSCVSFASSIRMDLPTAYRAALQLMAIHAHARSWHLAPPAKRKKRGQLKARELECLRWSSAGKSSAEIGMLLSISRRTVDEHIDNAMQKLGALTRIQAVAEALRQGFII